jgi:nucleoside-diphosphate-sugar epimerase
VRIILIRDDSHKISTLEKVKEVLNVSKINKLGWTAKTDLRTGIRKTYEDFISKFT